ncbi:MAG: sodium:proton antiporter [Verrucomicrobia bacterium]|nr:sodium:proton antiporter [Verrucomicrobiota bacterium]
MGALVPAHAVEQIQALLGQGTTNLVALAAAQPADVAHTLQALARMAPPGLASGNVSPDHLRIAYLLGNHELNKFVVAVSVSSVFFGAATYIGNGPNFMVKSIAEQRKIHVPSFVGYVFRFTLPCLLPVLLIVWWVFFRA